MLKYFFCLIFALGTSVRALFAQSIDDVKAMEGLMQTNHFTHEHHFTLKDKSVEEIVFGGMFYFYKKYLSSQDGGQCMFTPSCSEYGWQAVQKKGMFLGMIDGFDRLSRCNGLSRELYHKHPTLNKLYDPVE